MFVAVSPIPLGGVRPFIVLSYLYRLSFYRYRYRNNDFFSVRQNKNYRTIHRKFATISKTNSHTTSWSGFKVEFRFKSVFANVWIYLVSNFGSRASKSTAHLQTSKKWNRSWFRRENPCPANEVTYYGGLSIIKSMRKSENSALLWMTLILGANIQHSVRHSEAIDILIIA